MKSKKIIIFYPSFEDGGATENLINIVNFFTKKKVKVTLITNKNKINRVNKNKFLNVMVCKKNIWFFFIPFRWNIALTAMLNLLSYLKSNNQNSIVFSMQSHIPAIVVSKILGKKIIIRNSEEPMGATRYADNKILGIIVLISKFIFYNFANKIIAISKKSKMSLKKIVLKKSKIKLIYNPYIVNICREKRKRKSKKKFIILITGRLTYQKNIIPIIDSVNNLINKNYKIHLKIIGKGNQEIKIQNIIYGNKNVSLKTWKRNIKREYLTSDLFILNSFYEGLPNALIDAINYEIPAISSNVSGAEDILFNGKGGYIVPINNQEKLEKTIEYVINNYLRAKNRIKYAKKRIEKFGQKNLKNFYSEIIDI